MSAADDGADLKAGHPPAVKVGGMRVVQQKKHAGDGEAKKETMTPEEEEEFGAGEPKADKHHINQLVSGAVTKGDKDFPEAAVKAFHEKPQPSHEKRPNVAQQHNIQQPRK